MAIINNADALMELSTRHLLDNWPVVETVRATQNYEGDPGDEDGGGTLRNVPDNHKRAREILAEVNKRP